jgi:hypothetical protein
MFLFNFFACKVAYMHMQKKVADAIGKYKYNENTIAYIHFVRDIDFSGAKNNS